MRGPLPSCCAVVEAAEYVLERGFRIPMVKALDPLDRGGFDLIVGRLRTALMGVAAEQEAAALRKALQLLDVDWKGMSIAQQDAAVEAARLALGKAADGVLPKVNQQFRIVGPTVVGESRASSIRRFGLQLDVNMTQRDLLAEKFVRESAANFIRDQYGVVRDELSVMAREIVARGMAEGMGSDAIHAELEKALGDKVMKGPGYWQTVAMSFTNQARTFSQLNAYAEAGIQLFDFEAVMDEVTTDQCRFYHGKTFSVGSAQTVMNRLMAAKTPDEVKGANPWVRVGKDESGGKIIYIDRGGGLRTVLASVDRSGYGSKDDVGEYSNAVDTRRLETEGVPFPPLHGHCRSTTVPRVA